MSDIVDRKLREMQERRGSLIDGMHRPADLEEKINGAFRAAFSSPSGQAVIDYLRSITLHTVLPPQATNEELRMQEGMRRLFGIIEARRNSQPPAKEK